ncbi:major facilitator superfamily protein [gamma proteobacterium NOR5-3]|nr:major facilitator superfamily protein [gamma proteobacterium NOR5-3]
MSISYQESLNKSKITSAHLLLLLTCFCLNMVDGYDVLSIAFAAPPLATEWDLQAKTLGLLMSAGVFGMTLGAIFLAPLTDTLGRRKMVLAAVSVMGCSMILSSRANGLTELIALRVLTGLGTGAMLASLTALISEFFPTRHRDLAIGVTLAGYPIGATLGGFLAAKIISIYSWQGVFMAGGIATLLLVPVILAYLPESVHFLMRRRPHEFLATANKVLGRLGLPATTFTADTGEAIARASVRSLLSPSRRNMTLWLWSGFFLTFGTLYFLLSWIPKLLVDSGVELSIAIYASSFFNLAGALGNVGMGAASSRLGLGKSILGFAVLSAFFMLVFAMSSLETSAILTLAALIGFFQQGALVGFYILSAQVYPPETRATGIGWGIGLGRFGAVIAPYMGGVLVTRGLELSSLFIVYALPLAAAGIIGLGICRRYLNDEER